MTDFIADLEAELVAAARRRANRRHRVLALPRLRPATALAFVALAALVVALFVVARGLDRACRRVPASAWRCRRPRWLSRARAPRSARWPVGCNTP